MRESKRLIQNTGIIAIGNMSTKLVSFFLLPLYTSILSTAEYGIVDYIVSISTFCVPFISVLMDESMFRFLIDCKTEGERAKIISMSMLIILTGGGIFLIVAIPILWIIKYYYAVYVVVYVLSAVLSTMMSALLRGIGKTDYYAVFNFFTSLLKILLNILFIAVLYWGVQGMLLASILAQICVSVLYIQRLKLWKYVSFDGINKQLAKEMIYYSVPLIPNKISWSIINLSDRIIIMNSLGSDASGLYAVSYKFPNLMDTVYGFFYQSWKESSARVMGDKSQNDFYNIIYEYLKDFLYSMVLVMTAFMPLIFYFMVDKAFYGAILYVPILLLGMYYANISGFYGGIFTAYKDTKIMGTTTIVSAIINLIVNLILIHSIGLYAAAISTLAANFLVYIYRKNKVQKYVELYENRIKQLFSIITTIFVLLFFYAQEDIFIFINCCISIVYAVIANKKLLDFFLKNIGKRILGKL